MIELVYGKRREGNIGERDHLITHGVGIELASDRILHPAVRDKNPPCAYRGSQSRQPCRREMESPAYFLPAEEHDGNECALHEECHNTLNGERRAKDIAYEP